MENIGGNNILNDAYNENCNVFNLYDMSIATLNMRSINSSDFDSKNTLNKFDFVIKNKYDMIFLTEVKSGCPKRFNLVKKYLEINDVCRYNIYINSNKFSRGVAIMTKASLNFSIASRYDSADENSLYLMFKNLDYEFLAAVIYAPNNAPVSFYEDIKRRIESYGKIPFICGGDFNAIPSDLPVNINPDIEFSAGLPNLNASKCLYSWLDNG